MEAKTVIEMQQDPLDDGQQIVGGEGEKNDGKTPSPPAPTFSRSTALATMTFSFAFVLSRAPRPPLRFTTAHGGVVVAVAAVVVVVVTDARNCLPTSPLLERDN